jgi:hypothetical protein
VVAGIVVEGERRLGVVVGIRLVVRGKAVVVGEDSIGRDFVGPVARTREEEHNVAGL